MLRNIGVLGDKKSTTSWDYLSFSCLKTWGTSTYSSYTFLDQGINKASQKTSWFTLNSERIFLSNKQAVPIFRWVQLISFYFCSWNRKNFPVKVYWKAYFIKSLSFEFDFWTREVFYSCVRKVSFANRKFHARFWGPKKGFPERRKCTWVQYWPEFCRWVALF